MTPLRILIQTGEAQAVAATAAAREPLPSPALVAMHADVLLPALDLAHEPADAVLTPFAAGTVPPVPVGLVDLRRLADR